VTVATEIDVTRVPWSILGKRKSAANEMTTFRFRLATVLKLRQAARDRRRTELAQGYEAERILQQRKDQLAEELSETKRETVKASRPGSVDVDRLLLRHRHRLVLLSQQQQVSEQQEQLAAEIERRRQLLVEADRQVRVLEKLKEKRLESYNAEQQRLETRTIDEVAGLRSDREND